MDKRAVNSQHFAEVRLQLKLAFRIWRFMFISFESLKYYASIFLMKVGVVRLPYIRDKNIIAPLPRKPAEL